MSSDQFDKSRFFVGICVCWLGWGSIKVGKLNGMVGNALVCMEELSTEPLPDWLRRKPTQSQKFAINLNFIFFFSQGRDLYLNEILFIVHEFASVKKNNLIWRPTSDRVVSPCNSPFSREKNYLMSLIYSCCLVGSIPILELYLACLL